MKDQTTVSGLIADTFHNITAGLAILVNSSELVAEKSISSAEKLIYIPYYTYNYELIHKFYQQITTKHSHEDIIASGENFEDEKVRELFIHTYNSILILRKDMRFRNAKAFLSLFGIEYHNTTIDNYIRHLKTGNIYKYIKNEPWDENFIKCLAVLYVTVAYHELALSRTKLLPFCDIITAVLKKTDKPEDIINQLNHLKAYALEFFEKLELEVELADVFPEYDAETFPFDGILYIPWEFVTFYDEYFLIDHPKFYMKGGSKNSYKYLYKESKAAFNHIVKAFSSKLPPIMVECNRGNISKVINAGDISICVTTLQTGKFPPKIRIEKSTRSKQKQALTLEEYISAKDQYKSQYLEYLAEHLYFDSTIYHCRECRLNSSSNTCTFEDAFIFCLSNTVLLYENVLDKRASVLFQIEPGKIEECAEVINSYFSSDKIEDKRQKIAYESTLFIESGIKDYKRIYHNSFSEWKSDLLSYLKYR